MLVRTRKPLTVAGVFALAAALVAGPGLAATAAPGDIVVNDTFEAGIDGWASSSGTYVGSESVSQSSAVARTGTSSLAVTERTQSYMGATRTLTSEVEAGVEYEVSLWVRLEAPAADAVVFVTEIATPVTGDAAFTYLGGAGVTDSAWTEIVVPTGVLDPFSAYALKVESAAAVDFFIDDVTLTQGGEVEPPIDPPVDPPVDPDLIADDSFETDSVGWVPAAGAETVARTTDAARTGDYSLAATDRTESFMGATRSLPGAVAGERYEIVTWLRLVDPAGSAFLNTTSIATVPGTPPLVFDYLGGVTVTGAEWTRLSTIAEVPADATEFRFKVEGTAGADFYIDDVTVTRVLPAPPVQSELPGLRDIYEDDFLIGAAMSTFQTEGPVAELIGQHFNSLTAEYQMKWADMQPEEGVFVWDAADALIEFAKANDMAVRGHTLVWHQGVPDWLFLHPETGAPLTNSPADQQILIDRMETHITTVMQRYEDDGVLIWDVVNEVIDEKEADGYRKSRWHDILGTEYIDLAFEIAREAVPDAVLYYNDYETEFMFKAQPVYDMLAGLIERGVPVDGIGHQMHLTMYSPTPAQVDESLALFAQLPLEQAVTELDVAVSVRSVALTEEQVTEELLLEQAYHYRDLFDVFMDYRDELVSVTTWGMHDGMSWLNNWPTPRYEAPLFFDRDLQAKPAYFAVADLEADLGTPRPEPIPVTIESSVRGHQADGETVLLAGDELVLDVTVEAAPDSPFEAGGRVELRSSVDGDVAPAAVGSEALASALLVDGAATLRVPGDSVPAGSSSYGIVFVPNSTAFIRDAGDPESAPFDVEVAPRPVTIEASAGPSGDGYSVTADLALVSCADAVALVDVELVCDETIDASADLSAPIQGEVVIRDLSGVRVASAPVDGESSVLVALPDLVAGEYSLVAEFIGADGSARFLSAADAFELSVEQSAVTPPGVAPVAAGGTGGGALAVTGAESMTVAAVIAALLLVAGLGSVAASRRRATR